LILCRKSILRKQGIDPFQPVIRPNFPEHVIDQVKKHVKTEWKPQLSKPRIRIFDEAGDAIMKDVKG
jgi:predicted Zn-dependent peptidase